jgi:glutamate racemase
VDNRAIACFDSGIGGLSIWQAIHSLLPHESLIYLADSSDFPYGDRHPAELQAITARVVQFLRTQQVKLVVVACNTASVAALHSLRAMFPDLPFVGVVPVIKMLAHESRTGVLGVLSTLATANSPYLRDLIREFAADKEVISIGCAGLAELIEHGEASGPEMDALLRALLLPNQGCGADVVGLSCTHYPFARDAISRIVGPAVRILDPSYPVARRVAYLLSQAGAQARPNRPSLRFLTTGDPDALASVAGKLLNLPAIKAESVNLALPARLRSRRDGRARQAGVVRPGPVCGAALVNLQPHGWCEPESSDQARVTARQGKIPPAAAGA